MKEKIIARKQIVVIFIFLSPLLFFGYTADDRQHVLQQMLWDERGVWDNIEAIANDILNMQRFFPLHIMIYSTLFKIFDYGNAWVYHGLLIALNIFAYRSFGRWINEFFNINLDDKALLIFLTTMQFRVSYSDPIVSYFGLMQVFAIAQFEGMIFLKKYFVDGNVIHKIKWMMLLTSQLLLYELTLFMAPITFFYLYVNRRLNIKRYQSACASALMLIIIYLVMYVYIKLENNKDYTGTKISLKIGKIAGTTIIEALGSLPLSYAGYVATQKLEFNGLIIWGLYFFFMSSMTLVIMKWSRMKVVQTNDSRLVLYGVLIWGCSAFSIAFSERYQKELTLGLTYLVSYMQNFGYVMVVYCITRKYEIRKLLIGLCALTFILNAMVLNETAKIDGAKRIAMEVLTNKNINKEIKFETLILNEKIMQDENEFGKNIGDGVKEIIYIKLSELDKKKSEVQNKNVGIVIVQKERFGKASMIVGEYELVENKIYNANIFTKDMNAAGEASMKLNGVISKIKNDRNEEFYMVKAGEAVKIDGEIRKKYR
jgi:hypothetical protein